MIKLKASEKWLAMGIGINLLLILWAYLAFEKPIGGGEALLIGVCFLASLLNVGWLIATLIMAVAGYIRDARCGVLGRSLMTRFATWLERDDR